MSEETLNDVGAECPNCGTVTEDDDAWIRKHGEDDVHFVCEGCGTPLIVNASFSIDYTTRAKLAEKEAHNVQ